MPDSAATRTFDRFCDHSLPRAEWTHAAHLAVCWAALRSRDAPDAIVFLRRSIRSYNEAVGVANTPTSGYHETITRYFVHAVASLHAGSIDDVLRAPRCHRDAPLRHWSRHRLFSPQARTDWVAPDLEPLDWHS